ncbi:TetR/AcrR family transcriptional regulator [Nonomuraea pusilla]|uniref:Transcriptional regulator, TetR family n=1 Tax=Nonomuraea pusilla TaxID=46177 RepID=A0A1H8JTH5_9ACTN|nr:TetR/AcrR family transcriptional regulator [Nonomuraea pusilla]SEN84002.1 transcriptional regulator, TetR family [Nonomuraea pusilla]
MTGKSFSSVWLREPRRSTSPGRSREEIVRAAVELLDAEGLNGLSMRKLGAKLMAGATSLYWYVANKDELLELAYDEIWGEIELPEPSGARWREVTVAAAHGMRRVMLRHAWVADLLGRVPALGPHALGFTSRLRATFQEAGFQGLEIDYATSTMTAYVFGMTIPELAWQVKYAESELTDADVRSLVEHVVKDHPGLAESMNAASALDTREVREMCFAFGLHSMLDGLERRLVT